MSADSKALYVVVETPGKRYYLVQVVNQRDLYYSPTNDESQLI